MSQRSLRWKFSPSLKTPDAANSRRSSGLDERGRAGEGLVTRLALLQAGIGQLYPKDAFTLAVEARSEACFAGMNGLREAAALIDAPEPEVTENLAIAFGGADHHAGKLPVEFTRHDDRSGVVLRRPQQQAAIFSVSGRGDLEVEPRGEQREAGGEEEGRAGNASEAAPTSLHGREFLLGAHAPERDEYAGEKPER